MAFSDFTLRRALETFGLTEERDRDLFGEVAALEPSAYAQAWLDEFAPVAVGINSELARSAFIITPLLAEARRQANDPSNVMPGVTLDVDRGRGLNGFCDYLLTRAPEYYFLRGPIVAVVEAKREDLIGGLGQCAATMVALVEFNRQDGTPTDAVYGAVTSGSVWRFLQLSGTTLSIDRDEYYLSDAGKIVGILVHLIGNGVRDRSVANTITSS